MPKVVLTCDEIWPAFDLEIPKKGDEPNCECSNEFYEEYFHISKEYKRLQNELKSFYEEQEEKYPYHIRGYSFPEGPIPLRNQKMPESTNQRLWPILQENSTELH